jgi:hypothetical protein
MKRYLNSLFARSARPRSVRSPLTRRHRANLQVECLEARQLLSGVYDIAADFSATANPNGVWSYGYLAKSATPETPNDNTFTPYTQNGPTYGVDHWGLVNGGWSFGVYHNSASQAVSVYGDDNFQPNQAAFQAGPDGQYSVFRFTAPQAGSYSLSTTFTGICTQRSNATDVHVLLNGRDLFPNKVELAGQYQSSLTDQGTLTLAQGEKVDFVLGGGPNSIQDSDMTAVAATLMLTNSGSNATAPPPLPPASAMNAHGNAELFAVNLAGDLFEQTESAGGGYSATGWNKIDSSIRSVVVGRNANGNVEVFAVNTAGSLFEQTEAAAGGYSINSWRQIGDTITTLATTHGANGQAEVFAVNTAGSLFEQTEAGSGGYSPTGWWHIGDTITTLATSQDAHGNAEVFAVNTAGSLFEQTERAGSGGYSPTGWWHIDDAVASVVAGGDAFGNPEVFVVDTSGNLFEQTQSSSGYSRSGWHQIGTSIRT